MAFKFKEYVSYACPGCHCWSGDMDCLLDEKYEPTELEKRKHPLKEHIWHEKLKCKCGRILTWFDMMEVDENLQTLD